MPRFFAFCSTPKPLAHKLLQYVGLPQTGLASARARGRKGGAPYKMTPAKLRLAMASVGNRETNIGDLCKELGITRQALYRHVAPD